MAPRLAARDPAVLAVLLAGTFMAALDVSIVNVAAPQIRSGLGVSDAELQLIVSGYTVAYAALLLTGARLGDDHGHRRLFLLGLAGFTATSLAAGLAWNGEGLIVARVAQGVAAAAMTPQVVTVIQLRFGGDARARALALFATVIAFGAALGQVLGGLLVSADVAGTSWRPVFLLNVPIGIALLVLGRRVLPPTRSQAPQRLDLWGVTLLTSAVLLVMVPLVFGREAHWAPWTWASLIAALPTSAILLAHLGRLGRIGGHPLLDLTLLRHRPVTVGLMAVSTQMIAYGGFLFSLTFHLQGALAYPPWQSGLIFGPYAIGFAVTSIGVPRLRASRRHAVSIAGLLLMTGGYAAIGLAAGRGEWDSTAILPLLAIAGAGFGAGYSPVITRIVAEVPAENARDASGLFTTINQLSFAFGVATIGTVFLARSSGSASGAAVAMAAGLAGGLGIISAGLVVLLGRVERRSQPTPDAAER
ncbi:MFS transporter [Iamia sp.]|uniref:MFS transporter n=1 Tax=Iamia sp. TaxID=2722710 RepID=UPI002B93C5AF|nr:MFS transporter [Iamia sp.]HXH57288.1 MFS transporter [Iamia sp.]